MEDVIDLMGLVNCALEKRAQMRLRVNENRHSFLVSADATLCSV